ncbi:MULTISPECIES: hypothetical protein [unclassified Blastococcus]
MTGRRSARDLLLRLVLPAVLLVAAVGVLVGVLAGGSDGDDDADGPPAAASSAPATTSGPEDQPPAEEELTPTAPPPTATQLPAPPVVTREGVEDSARTIDAAPADFAAPAQWSDGASVRVVEARQQVTAGSGPGELAGQPQTVFRLELVNGAATPLVLDAVVVQASYGDPALQASPLYDGETVDFGGTLAPGESAGAVYSFAIPADRLGAVTLSVDVDGYRFPAVFSGAVPA